MVDMMPRYVDMAITPQERANDYPSPVAQDSGQPIYPYGLSISFCQDEIDKLDLESECDIGDMVELNCIAKVTSVSKNDSTDGPKTRIELQIIAIEANGDDTENDQPVRKLGRKSPY